MECKTQERQWEHKWEEIGAKCEDDITKSAAVRLEVEQYHAIKVLVAKRQWLMRDFFSKAFVRLAAKRQAWAEESPDEAFVYVAGPREGKSVSFSVLEGHVEDLERWAERDNVYLRSAYYTAVYEFLQEVKAGEN